MVFGLYGMAGAVGQAGPNPPHLVIPLEQRDHYPQEKFDLSAAPSVEWQYHKTSDSSHPDGNEQQMMWLMNRARSDPQAEGQWLATSTDPDIAGGRVYFGVTTSVLTAEFASYAAKPPAAFDTRLYEAAASHNEYMKAYGGNTHDGQFDRVIASGFSYTQLRGNVFAYAESALNAHAAFNIDWGSGQNGMQDSRGHRKAIMSLDGDYTNVGLAQTAYSGNGVGPNLVTGNYANASGSNNCFNRFLVGTVWKDADGDGMYDPGEGRGGVLVMPDKGTYYAYTADSGGYAIPIDSAGDYTVTFSGGDLSGTVTKTVTVGGGSVLCDVTEDGTGADPDPDTPPTSNYITLPSVDPANAMRFCYKLAYNYQRDQYLVAWLEKMDDQDGRDAHVNLATVNRSGQIVNHVYFTIASGDGSVDNLGLGTFRDTILLAWPQKATGASSTWHRVKGRLFNWDGLTQSSGVLTLDASATEKNNCLISYNTYLQEFLVAWQSNYSSQILGHPGISADEFQIIKGVFVSNLQSQTPDISALHLFSSESVMLRKLTGLTHNVATGDWLMVYEGWDGSYSGIYATRVSHDLSSESEILIHGDFDNFNPRVIGFEQGVEYLLTWTNHFAGYYNVNARVLDRDGHARGSLKGMSASVTESRYSSVAGWTRCGLNEAMVVWNEENQGGGSRYNLRAKKMTGPVNGDFDNVQDAYTLVQGSASAQPWTPEVVGGANAWFVVWLSISDSNPGYANLMGTFIAEGGGCILSR